MLVEVFDISQTGFRRGWGSYQSIYLFAKFSTLLIVAVIDPDTCLFRSVSRSLVPVVRQIVLLISTIGFFLAQSIYSPFLDPLNNASEWTSRLNYVLTATVALFVALNIPGKEIFSTYVLYMFVSSHIFIGVRIAEISVKCLYYNLWPRLLYARSTRRLRSADIHP